MDGNEPRLTNGKRRLHWRGETERWLPRMVEEGVSRGWVEKSYREIYRLGRLKAKSGRRTRPLLDLLDARL